VAPARGLPHRPPADDGAIHVEVVDQEAVAGQSASEVAPGGVVELVEGVPRFGDGPRAVHRHADPRPGIGLEQPLGHRVGLEKILLVGRREEQRPGEEVGRVGRLGEPVGRNSHEDQSVLGGGCRGRDVVSRAGEGAQILGKGENELGAERSTARLRPERLRFGARRC
jgi:hypothetical protein